MIKQFAFMSHETKKKTSTYVIHYNFQNKVTYIITAIMKTQPHVEHIDTLKRK